MLTSTRLPPSRRTRRRRRILTRALPFAGLALAAFVVGIVLAFSTGGTDRKLVVHYIDAWEQHEYPQMYAMLDHASQQSISESRFAGVIRHDARTATETVLVAVRVGAEQDKVFPVRMLLHTHLFGPLSEVLKVTVNDNGPSPKIHLTPQLLFPGLLPGENLTRTTVLAARGTILAADGEVLAQGPDRTSPIPGVANQIVGQLGSIPATDKAKYAAQGYPPDAKVGLDGLEQIFQRRLAGKPGGTLKAGSRVLATTVPVPGKTVKSTIVPSLEQAALSAIGSSYAGMTVMNPKTGGILAAVGIAFSDVQPPGSTMKIVTSSAALAAGDTTLNTTYAYTSGATLDGYNLQNAGGEVCGGTLINSFAVSCNAVFAPLGAKVGAAKFVAMAEKFGFNQPPPFPGAVPSTLPSASKIGDDLAVGSSAIGQGMVLASSMEMTDVAATIADHGRRPIPTLAASVPPKFVRAISPTVAGEVQQMMEAVVDYPNGTGTAAQIPGVQVAGKTGTAELTTTQGPGAQNNPNANSAQNTDAWFVGYAPVGNPKVVVGALFPNQGAGGGTAAPAVRQVLVAALQG
jgi:cell division protein FtsI/penicillin-binding protein 2